MIGWFPTPLEDEIWYSVCARYGKIVNFSMESLMLELTGRKTSRISVDLPSLLNVVISRLPNGHKLSSERIIASHTLLPFYAPFLPEKNLTRVINLMINKNGAGIHAIAGINSSPIKTPEYLKFCPICAQDDQKKEGVSYWHRLHQVPGVLVCPDHKVFLEDSSAKSLKLINSIQLFCAEDYVKKDFYRNLDKSNQVHQALLKIAGDAKWILEQKNIDSKNTFLKKKITELLRQKGFFDEKRIEVKKLTEHLKSCYPNELLQALNSDFDSPDSRNWLYHITLHLRGNRLLTPIRQILLIGALDRKISSFISEDFNNSVTRELKEVDEFIKGPYPCLNPICEHYLNLSIVEYEIKHHSKSKENSIIISCKCGFKYRRKGKDISKNDIFRKNEVINYGKLWGKKLSELWESKDLSVYRIAKILGIGRETLVFHAALKKLTFPRIDLKGNVTIITASLKQRVKAVENREKIRNEKFIKLRNSRRNKWLKFLKDNADSTITELKITIAPTIARWLYRKDREWFDEHRPAVILTNKKIDWDERDKLCLQQAKYAVKHLLSTQGFPLWIRKQSISRYLDNPNWLILQRYRKKMPLTLKFVNELCESRLEFNLRKIRWAVEEIKKEGGSSKTYKIADKAHVHWNFQNNPEIKAALAEGRRNLESAKSSLS